MAAIVHSIEYVAIELAPLESEDRYIPEYYCLPYVWAAALDEVVDAVDSATCSNCNEGLGYLLHEDDDEPRRSGVRWHAVWLAREDGGQVQMLCEDCAPYVPTKVAAL
jgi:hypothetical protein